MKFLSIRLVLLKAATNAPLTGTAVLSRWALVQLLTVRLTWFLEQRSSHWNDLSPLSAFIFTVINYFEYINANRGRNSHYTFLNLFLVGLSCLV